jgi:hypothetical protein
MTHYERLQEKKDWIAAKTDHEILEIRLLFRNLMVKITNKDRDFYREAESKGIHVSCEEIAHRNAVREKAERWLRREEEYNVRKARNKKTRFLMEAYEKFHERIWTCEDDGFARPFIYRRRPYYRTFDGAVWKANETKLGDWVGFWNGIYIAKGKEPSRPSIF